MSSSVTYTQLHTLLRGLQFVEVRLETPHTAFHHSGSDTLIVMANRKRARRAGRSDLASVRRHLVDNGIVSEDAFDQFLHEGCLPQPE